MPNGFESIFTFDMRWLAMQFLQKHYPDFDFAKTIKIKDSLISEWDMEISKYNDSLVKNFFKIK